MPIIAMTTQSDVADAADDVVLERPQRRRHAPGVEVDLAGGDGTTARKRKAFEPDRQHALDVGVGLLERDAVAQARDAVATERRRNQLRAIDAKRHDELGAASPNLKPRGMTPTISALTAIDFDALADDVGIAAEPRLPVAVRQAWRRAAPLGPSSSSPIQRPSNGGTPNAASV